MSIQTTSIDVAPATYTTAGSANVASTTSTLRLNGMLEAVYVDYGAGVASPATLWLKTASVPNINILTLGSQGTDIMLFPRYPTVNSSGIADTGISGANIWNRFPLNTPLQVVMSGLGSAIGMTTTVYVLWDKRV